MKTQEEDQVEEEEEEEEVDQGELRVLHQLHIFQSSLHTTPITESDNTFPTTATTITVVPKIQTTARNILLSEIIHYSEGTTDYTMMLFHCLVSDNSYFSEVVD